MRSNIFILAVAFISAEEAPNMPESLVQDSMPANLPDGLSKSIKKQGITLSLGSQECCSPEVAACRTGPGPDPIPAATQGSQTWHCCDKRAFAKQSPGSPEPQQGYPASSTS
ncbi:hypothetical protein DSO57_1032725 [Entomophthora muscae]|uniref:Uncharacterized protein n=1 Tax=Entomophthora muscae TaxID=34485 RepID=A0ACC2RF16_9FUNG|nr:hypothetical protein DSO57_1032725 [Entomophthora muscae]